MVRATYTLYVETKESKGDFEYARELTKTELMKEIKSLIDSLFEGETITIEIEREEV